MLTENRLSSLSHLAGDILAESEEIPFHENVAISAAGLDLADAFEDMPDLTEQDMVRFVFEALPQALAEAGLPLVEAGWLHRAAAKIGRAAFAVKHALTKQRSGAAVAKGAVKGVAKVGWGVTKVAGRIAGGALKGAAQGAVKSLSPQKQAAVHKFVGAGLKAGAKGVQAAKSAAKTAAGAAVAAHKGYKRAAAAAEPKALPAAQPAAKPAAKSAATKARSKPAWATPKRAVALPTSYRKDDVETFGYDLGLEIAEAFCEANVGNLVSEDEVVSYVVSNVPSALTETGLDEIALLKHIASVAKGAIRGAKAAHAAAKQAALHAKQARHDPSTGATHYPQGWSISADAMRKGASPHVVHKPPQTAHTQSATAPHTKSTTAVSTSAPTKQTHHDPDKTPVQGTKTKVSPPPLSKSRIMAIRAKAAQKKSSGESKGQMLMNLDKLLADVA